MDQKLARGHVRQELRTIERNTGVVRRAEAALNPIADLVHERGHVPIEAMRRAIDAAAAVFADSPNTLAIARDGTGRTLSRRKAYERVRATVLIRSERMRHCAFECIEHLVTPTAYHCTGGTPPVELSWHACERLMERRGAASEPAWTLASDVVGMLGLISLLVRPAHALPGAGLAVPLRGGLLLGAVQTTFQGHPSRHCEFYYGGSFTRGEVRDLPGYYPGFLVDPGSETMLVFHARTWIGPAELGPDQVEYARRILAVAERHPDAVAAIGLGATYPYAPEYAVACNNESPLAADIDAACDAAIDALVDPALRRVTGSTGATTRPERPTEWFKRQSRIGGTVQDVIARALAGARDARP